MMGTSGLMISPGKQQEPPAKGRSRPDNAGHRTTAGNGHRTKISTVYLPPPPPPNNNNNNSKVVKCCDSKVTVNGRHHCNCGKNAVSSSDVEGSVVNV